MLMWLQSAMQCQPHLPTFYHMSILTFILTISRLLILPFVNGGSVVDLLSDVRAVKSTWGWVLLSFGPAPTSLFGQWMTVIFTVKSITILNWPHSTIQFHWIQEIHSTKEWMTAPVIMGGHLCVVTTKCLLFKAIRRMSTYMYMLI
jgi:hypothetical protein